MHKYYDLALGYLSSYYKTVTTAEAGFGYAFIKRLSEECDAIGRDAKLRGIEMENALMAVCFRYAGVANIFTEESTGPKLFEDFTKQAGYPQEQVSVTLDIILRHTKKEDPRTVTEEVVWDALDYRLAMDDTIGKTILLADENGRTTEHQSDELSICLKLLTEFTNSHYRTAYAKKHYTDDRHKNENRLEKRIQRLTSVKDTEGSTSVMSDRETEDLFKIAFRNYVKLVDVADSKAALLIHVNSILISVVIGFVVSRSEKYPVLTIPAFIVLGVAFLTILLSILASRPQKNLYLQDKSSKSYQTFFFGSFDLIGTEFRDADYETYSRELDEFFKGGKERVYAEIYKEVFNVRKVLSKKFTFLSYAYMVFLGGLLLSIIAFFIATRGTPGQQAPAAAAASPLINDSFSFQAAGPGKGYSRSDNKKIIHNYILINTSENENSI